MHHYTYSWGKESEGDMTYLPYLLKVTVKLPAEEMWKEWERSITDVEKCWMWPTKYSKPRADEVPLRDGTTFHLDYQMPNYRDPDGPLLDLSYDYKMVKWRPEEMYCDYEGVGSHPFRGGAFVRVIAIDEEFCLLHWEGKYQYKTGEKGMVGMERNSARYFNAFLIAVAENIQDHTGH